MAINGREVQRILTSWVKRHGLEISNVYRDQFFYVDMVDDAGNEYEISVAEHEEADALRVRVWQRGHKRSVGSRADLSNLEDVLEAAYSTVTKWVSQSGGTRVRAL